MQAELGRPNSSQPDKGKVSIYIDCSATAAPIYQVVISLLYCFLGRFFVCHINHVLRLQ